MTFQISWFNSKSYNIPIISMDHHTHHLIDILTYIKLIIYITLLHNHYGLKYL